MKKSLWFSFWCIATLAFSSAHAVEKTIIVFDASGSMWGQIDGKTKIEIAKNTLREVVSEWDNKKPLGLIAYGHRNKGDCRDIEVIVPISKVNKPQFIQKVQAISPKGKTPISQSLQRAAKALRHNQDKATIILISDGKETCQADPCATAKQLKKEGVDLVAHVVGFQVDKTTDSQLACIAKATGGEYFSANDAKSLNSALKTVVKTTQQPKEAKEIAQNQAIIHLLDKPNGQKRKAYHDIYRMENGAKRLVNSCQSTPEAGCTIALDAGDYVVDSYFKENSASTAFHINNGKKTEVNVVISTGKLTLSASDGEGGKVLDAHHSIRSTDKKSSNIEIASCASNSEEPCVQELPAGEYTITSQFGNLKITTPLTVKLGESQKINVILATGKITLSASDREGGKVLKASHSIGGKNENGSSIEVASCSSDSEKPCVKELQTGEYKITSQFGNLKVVTPLTINAGQNQKINVILATGKLTLSASKNGQVVQAHHSIRGKNENGSTIEVTTCSSSSTKPCILELPASKYHIESIYYDKEKTRQDKKTPFAIQAGDNQQLNIVF